MSIEMLSTQASIAKELLSTAHQEIKANEGFPKQIEISLHHFRTEAFNKTLTPMGEETKERLLDSGYDEKVIECIGSEEEVEIYDKANLECREINGKPALVRPDVDIDLEQKDAHGRTNLERMQAGKAPLDKDGIPIELHHIGQGKDAPLAELTKQEHCGPRNKVILHPKNESEIDRASFAKERAEHWKARAEYFKHLGS